MLSVIIATHESERALVPTLAALVPGATAGLLGEVIVADGGSRDATAEVADVAGCRFMASGEPLGARLKAAAATTRTPWLMFLRAGCVPEPGWVEAADRFKFFALNSDTRRSYCLNFVGYLQSLEITSLRRILSIIDMSGNAAQPENNAGMLDTAIGE